MAILCKSNETQNSFNTIDMVSATKINNDKPLPLLMQITSEQLEPKIFSTILSVVVSKSNRKLT